MTAAKMYLGVGTIHTIWKISVFLVDVISIFIIPVYIFYSMDQNKSKMFNIHEKIRKMEKDVINYTLKSLWPYEHLKCRIVSLGKRIKF